MFSDTRTELEAKVNSPEVFQSKRIEWENDSLQSEKLRRNVLIEFAPEFYNWWEKMILRLE